MSPIRYFCEKLDFFTHLSWKWRNCFSSTCFFGPLWPPQGFHWGVIHNLHAWEVVGWDTETGNPRPVLAAIRGNLIFHIFRHKINFYYILSTEAKAHILGPVDLYVKTGSSLSLTCILSQGPHDLGTIFWYKGKSVVSSLSLFSPHFWLVKIKLNVKSSPQNARPSPLSLERRSGKTNSLGAQLSIH